jgi:hypothetical protein
MWTLDQLQQENLPVQTVQTAKANDAASKLKSSQSLAAVSVHKNLLAGNHLVSPSVSVAADSNSAGKGPSATEIVSVLNIYSQYRIQQELQNHQRIAAIRASLEASQTQPQATSPTTKTLDDVTSLLLRRARSKAILRPNCILASFFNVSSKSSRTYLPQIPETVSPTNNGKTHELQSFKRKKSTNVEEMEMSQQLTSRVDRPKETKSSKLFSLWFTMWELLKKFKEAHGHCIVLRGYEDSKLANWVRSPRPFSSKQFC